MICNSCGTALEESIKFCKNCGAAVGCNIEMPYTDSNAHSTASGSSIVETAGPAPSVICTTHTSTAAAGACVGCGSFFCRECLVFSQGRNYCRSCAVRFSAAPPIPQQPSVYSQTAGVYQPVQPVQAYTPQPMQPYTYTQPYAHPVPVIIPVRRKEPGVALLLSFLMPGLGQVYNGDVGKGIAFFISFWVTVWFFIGVGVWVWAMIDGYQSATNINMGRRI